MNVNKLLVSVSAVWVKPAHTGTDTGDTGESVMGRKYKLTELLLILQSRSREMMMEVKKRVFEQPPGLLTFSSHDAALKCFNELAPFKTRQASLSQMKENWRNECAEFQKLRIRTERKHQELLFPSILWAMISHRCGCEWDHGVLTKSQSSQGWFQVASFQYFVSLDNSTVRERRKWQK